LHAWRSQVVLSRQRLHAFNRVAYTGFPLTEHCISRWWCFWIACTATLGAHKRTATLSVASPPVLTESNQP